ncbi:carboxypeptidase-like regulatory domain-containing protein [Hymenobacter sp. UYP22]|uniref:carboxypeptidase-like regulatory domain-containing protein n=1 Tax=Hymenobacter sp. UYP22 TaxID=3156348 RepID=UPI003393B6F1
MDVNTSTQPEEVPSDLNLEEEDLSSGNRRLAIIVGAIVAVLVLGYVLLPAQATRRIANAMPVMELGEATVTASRPQEAAAEEEKSAEDEAAAKPATAAAKPTAAKPTAAAAVAVAPEAAPADEPVAVEPVPAAVAPAAAEAAPANVTMTGRILDENGRPMAGATVMVRGLKKVAGTDANGNYSIEVPAGENTLVYGYGGYEDQEVRTRSSQPQNVTLLPKEGARRKRR